MTGTSVLMADSRRQWAGAAGRNLQGISSEIGAGLQAFHLACCYARARDGRSRADIRFQDRPVSLEFATSARSRRVAVAASIMHAFHFAFLSGLVD